MSYEIDYDDSEFGPTPEEEQRAWEEMMQDHVAELVETLVALLTHSENMRHGGFTDHLLAVYDGWAREARAVLNKHNHGRMA